METEEKTQETETEVKAIELPIVIKLGQPIRRGAKDENTITELVIERRLKAKDFKGIQANQIMFDDMLKILSRLVALPLSVIEELDSLDMYRAVEVLNNFLPSGLATGDNR